MNNFSYNTHEFVTLITTKGTGKRVRLQEFELSTRTRRGLQIVREVKTNPYRILKTFIEDSKNFIGLKTDKITEIKITELPILDRYSTGKEIIKGQPLDAFIISSLEKPIKEQETLIDEPEIIEVIEEKKIPKKEKVSLKEIDDKLMTIDDFLKK